MKLLFYSQASSDAPLKFGNEYVNSSHVYRIYNYLSTLASMLKIYVSQRSSDPGSMNTEPFVPAFITHTKLRYLEHILCVMVRIISFICIMYEDWHFLWKAFSTGGQLSLLYCRFWAITMYYIWEHRDTLYIHSCDTMAISVSRPFMCVFLSLYL